MRRQNKSWTKLHVSVAAKHDTFSNKFSTYLSIYLKFAYLDLQFYLQFVLYYLQMYTFVYLVSPFFYVLRVGSHFDTKSFNEISVPVDVTGSVIGSWV